MAKKDQIRVEQLLVERGYTPSVERARALIMAGDVLIDTTPVRSGALLVNPETELTVRGQQQFVSRGGLKLDRALEVFAIDATDRVCADIGAATGGFSDVFLQRGAAKVFAVDVGYGDLHWKVRSDPRLVAIERTNARYLESLPEVVSLIAVDVSFISINLLWHNLFSWLASDGDIVVLLKPQFEAEQAEVSVGEGIISDPAIHRRVLRCAMEGAALEGLTACGVIPSPILGVHGNGEFLIWLKKSDLVAKTEIAPLLDDLFQKPSSEA